MLRFAEIKELPAFVSFIVGSRRTTPKAFGARFILSLALTAGSLLPEPLKKFSFLKSSINVTYVSVFHFLPSKFLLKRSISGIIFSGVRGDVVINKTLLSIDFAIFISCNLQLKYDLWQP